MIIDSETSTLYFSELLTSSPEYRHAFQRIQACLRAQNIAYCFLKGTKDIWARDYMPIQVTKDKLVQFQYKPSYLKKLQPYRSDPKEVNRINNFNVEYSQINLDGGNVVRWKDKVIITDRIFDENPGYNKLKLIAELEAILECQVIIIPQHKADITGHADGMIRFIDGDTVLINDLKLENTQFKKRIERVLKENNLNYINLPIFEYQCDSAIGVYINYLEVADFILVPVFEIRKNKDELALNVLKSTFPNRLIETVNINEIAKDGGVLNCVSWTL